MSLGAITTNKRAGQGVSQLLAFHIEFAGDDAYPTGGTTGFEDTVRSAVDRGDIDVLAIIPDDCGGFVPVYDRDNDTLMVYQGDNDAAQDDPLVEVPDTTDLSATTFKMTVLAV